MWRRLLRLTAGLLLLLALAAPARAQALQGQGEEAEKEGGPSNALPYMVAILSTALVMVIICKPSRKA